MRRLVRVTILASILLSSSACAGARAYVDWRPGLSAMDFDGTFEIGLDQYEAFADEAEAHTVFDRSRAISTPDASTLMAELGARLAASGGQDPRGYAIIGLDSDGSVRLLGNGGREHAGTAEWFAITQDRQWAALRTGSKLAVAVGEASTGIELGSLLGGDVGGYAFMMVVEGDELTVFVLPELGGAVTANEPGYVIAFRHRPGAREPWAISVARVSIRM